jgi:hypothetical protein
MYVFLKKYVKSMTPIMLARKAGKARQAGREAKSKRERRESGLAV